MNVSISSLLRWWADGLRSALPEQISNLIFGPVAVLSLSVRDNRAILQLEDSDGVHKLFDLALEQDPKTGKHRIPRNRTVRRAQAIDAGEIILRLDRGQVLSTQIELPARSALDLRAAVQADLDRFTPFSTEDIYFDAQIISVDNENDRIKVILQVAQIAEVERLVELARTVGLQPTRVTGARTPGGPNLNLLPVAHRYRPRRLLPKAVKAMTALLICAAALHAALLYASKQKALEDSQAYIRQLRTTAVAASDMEDRLTEFQAAVAWVEDAKIDHPSALGALAAITRALPDQSFLVGFEMLDDTFSLSGFSSDPTGMLLRLEEDDRLQNARFTAPTTRDARTGLNRFLVEVAFVREPK